jgi:HAMP domain-containing protein
VSSVAFQVSEMLPMLFAQLQCPTRAGFSGGPITSSDGTAPENGVVVFGYFLNESQAELFSTLTSTKVDVAPYTSGANNDGFSEARQVLSYLNPLFIENPKPKAEVIYGYGLVNDVFNNPALILRSGIDRSIFSQGQQIINLFNKIIIAVGVLFLLIVLFLLEFFVLKPLSRMAGEVQKIDLNKMIGSSPISIHSSDEFAYLGNEINMLFGNLQIDEAKKKELEEIKARAEKKLLENNKELNEKIAELGKMNSLMVGRELKMVELKKEIKELKNKPEDEQ